MMPFSFNITITLVTVVLLFAAVHDIAFRTIPNWIPAVVVVAGILLRVQDHQFLAGVICGVAIFALAAACWWRGYLGGGDVKLLGATAVLMPPVAVPAYVAAVAFAGGVLALFYLMLERAVPNPRLSLTSSFVRRILIVECRRIHRRISLPYATAISVAALLTLAKG